ncbi:MAG: hypothetical protein GY757_61705 [bacterium]|nr:hypothetical protein [bacterium]
MLKAQSDPFQYMVEHRTIIIETLDQSSTLKNAWNALAKNLPGIGVITKFNTFKGYVRILKVIDGRHSELIRENKSLARELGKVRQELAILEERLGRVSHNETSVLKSQAASEPSGHGEKKSSFEKIVVLPNHEKVFVPKRVDGWGVQLRGQYYRMFKKINGKVKWIHIGKKWNTEIAREKIRSFDGDEKHMNLNRLKVGTKARRL